MKTLLKLYQYVSIIWTTILWVLGFFIVGLLSGNELWLIGSVVSFVIGFLAIINQLTVDHESAKKVD